MHDPHDPGQLDPTLLRDSIEGLHKVSFRGKLILGPPAGGGSCSEKNPCRARAWSDFCPHFSQVSIKPNSVLFEEGKGVGETKTRGVAFRSTDVTHKWTGTSAKVTLRYYRHVTDGERSWIEETNHPDLPGSWRRAPDGA